MRIVISSSDTQTKIQNLLKNENNHNNNNSSESFIGYLTLHKTLPYEEFPFSVPSSGNKAIIIIIVCINFFFRYQSEDINWHSISNQDNNHHHHNNHQLFLSNSIPTKPLKKTSSLLRNKMIWIIWISWSRIITRMPQWPKSREQQRYFNDLKTFYSFF